jgi:hypothetical protein
MLFEGKVLDGRNRFNAAKLAGYRLQRDDVQLFEEACERQDPVAYVLSANILRRHLTVGQRSRCAAELYTRLRKSKNQRKSPIGDEAGIKFKAPTAEEDKQRAADTSNVGVKTLEQAMYVKEHGPEEYDKLKNGEITTHQAVQEVKRKARKAKASPDAHDLARKRIEKVCGKGFVSEMESEHVPGLKSAEDIVAGSLYRARVSLADAKRFAEKNRDNDGEWEVNVDWRIRDLLVLMKDKTKDRCRQLVDIPWDGELRLTIERVKPEKSGNDEGDANSGTRSN